MKKVFLLFLFLILLLNTSFSQELRKSMLSLTTGYVAGNNSSYENNSSQYLIWGDYYFSSLDQISGVYKKYKLNESGFDYNENFYAVKGLLNFFPFYFAGAFARIDGTYKNQNENYKTTGNIFSGEGTYYYNLFFFTIGGKYISFSGSDKLTAGFGEIKWRPSLYFSVSLGAQIMRNPQDSLFTSMNLDFFYAPYKFINFSLSGFAGERKYNFDKDYLIAYNIPDKEIGAYSTFVRIFPIKKIGFIMNYEKHFYDNFFVEYYSLSVKYNLLIGAD